MTTFQRCTDRGMADRLNQDNMVFGAPDDATECTPRQMRGAVLAGSVAGAIVGGPVVAATVAAGAAFAAATREGGIGDAARSMGDMASNLSEKTGKAINGTAKRCLQKSSSFTANEQLEAEVRRSEKQIRKQQQEREAPNRRRLDGHRIRNFSSSLCRHIKRKHKNLMETRARDKELRESHQQGQSDPRLTSSATARLENGPQPKNGWRLGRKPRAQSQNDFSSVDEYVTQHQSRKPAGSRWQRRGHRNSRALQGRSGSRDPSTMQKASSQTLETRSEGPSIVHKVVKRTLQPYALSRDELRALVHHVASQVLAMLANCAPVAAIRSSTLGIGVMDNYITSRDMKHIASYISHEVESAVEHSDFIQGNALTDSEVAVLARLVVRQVMAAVSNCAAIQDIKLSASEMQSLAGFMKDQAQNQAVEAISMSARELKSLACYVKLQAQQGLSTASEFGPAQVHSKMASDMDDFILSMEEDAAGGHQTRAHSDAYDSKQDYTDSDEGSYSDRSERSYDSEDRSRDGYDSRAGSDYGSDYSDEEGDDRSYDSRDSRRSYETEDDGYDSRDEDRSRRSYDSRYDDRSRCSYDSRDERPFQGHGNQNDEAKDDGSCFSEQYEESVCGDAEWEDEGQNVLDPAAGILVRTGNDSDGDFADAVDDFEDAVEDANEEEKESEAEDTDYPDLEEARELALQIIENMLLS